MKYEITLDKNLLDNKDIDFFHYKQTYELAKCELGTFYIGKYIDEDYSQLYDDNNNYTYWVTCEDIDYYWYEDKEFIMGEK